jgi:hypothetical protein
LASKRSAESKQIVAPVLLLFLVIVLMFLAIASALR